jgi:hypothetical protein
MNFLSLRLNNKRLIRNDLKKNSFALGSLAKFLKRITTGPWGTIHLSLRLCRKPPRVSGNRTRRGEKGGGAYRWRGCSSEVVEDVGEVSGITAMCRSPSGMVGVGRSACAGGDARRRRGIRPTHGAIGRLNGSESFTGC